MKPPICSLLHEAFNVLNQHLFKNELQTVGILFQPKKKIGIKYILDQKLIIVGSDFVNMGESAILGELLHEMVHIYNDQKGIIDVTTNQYHTTKYFLKGALSVGLVVCKHKTQGWSITSPIYPRNVTKKEFIHLPPPEILSLRKRVFASIELNKAVIKKTQSEIKMLLKDEKPTKTFFLKYVCNCPAPHNSIRSGRRPDGNNALNIVCQNCNSKFQCVSELD